MIHELKIHPEYFQDVILNLKKFEIRLNDRNYQEGDILILNEWNPETQTYTGRQVKRRVFNMYSNLPGLKPNYVLLQIRKLI